MGTIPDAAPLLGLDLRTPFNCAHTHDESEEDQEECQVHSGEHRGVPLGERREGCSTGGEKPNFIAIPVGANGTERLSTLAIVAGEESLEHSNAVVEALENQVHGPQDGDEDKPQNTKCHGSSFPQ